MFLSFSFGQIVSNCRNFREFSVAGTSAGSGTLRALLTHCSSLSVLSGIQLKYARDERGSFHCLCFMRLLCGCWCGAELLATHVF